MRNASWRFAAIVLGILPFAGCLWAPRSQVTTLEAQNQRLAEEQKAQLAEISNLRAHSREIEDQLLHTEKELSIVEEQSAIDRHRLAAYSKEREYLHQQFADMSRGAAPVANATQTAVPQATASRNSAAGWAGKTR